MKEKKTERIKHLLEKYGVNQKDVFGYYCIHMAVQHADLELVNYLLRNKCEVNVLSFSDETPLMLSCSASDKDCRLKIASLLIEAGSRFDLAERNSFETVVSAVTNRNDPSLLQLLIKHNLKLSNDEVYGVLNICCRNYYMENVETILNNFDFSMNKEFFIKIRSKNVHVNSVIELSRMHLKKVLFEKSLI